MFLPFRGEADDYARPIDSFSHRGLVQNANYRLMNEWVQVHMERGIFTLDYSSGEYGLNEVTKEDRAGELAKAGVIMSSRADTTNDFNPLDRAIEAAQQGEFWMGQFSGFGVNNQWLLNMVHEDAYQTLPRCYFGEDEYNQRRAEQSADLDAWIKVVHKYLPPLMAKKDQRSDEDMQARMRLTDGFGTSLHYHEEYKEEFSKMDGWIRRYLTSDQNVDQYSFRWHYADVITKRLADGRWNPAHPDLIELRDEIVEFMLFLVAFDGVGLTWTPLRVGAQGGEDIDIRLRWLEAQRQMAEKRKHRWD